VPLRRGIPAEAAHTYSSLEDAALKLRGVVTPTLDVDRPLPGCELFEKLERYRVKIAGKRYGVTYAISDLPSGVEGQARYESESDEFVVVLSPDTYKGLEDGIPRARFCLAHEIGHLVLHPRDLMRLAAIPHESPALSRRQTSNHAAYLDTEWQANAFAAALLMPAVGIVSLERSVGTLVPLHLQARFEVSAEAAEIRLRTFRERRTQLL
jgi:hypothetical protein